MKPPKKNTSPKLEGWTLTSGLIGGGETHYQNPSVSDVMNSLDTLSPRVWSAYLTLGKSPKEGTYQNYCLVCIVEEGYYCQIRQYGSSRRDYRHYRLLLPNEHGSCDEIEETRPYFTTGYDPDYTAVTTALLSFIADPERLPEIPSWRWMDNTEKIMRTEDASHDRPGVFRNRW